MEDAAEVREPDVDAVVRDELEQPVTLEREPNEVVDRVAEDRPDYRDDREDEEERNRSTREAAARQPPPRPDGRGGGSERGVAPAQERPTTR